MLAGRLATVLAGATIFVAIAADASAQSANVQTAPEPKPFINGFCLGVVAGASGVEAFRERLQTFGARPAPSGAMELSKPVDIEISGQLFRFPDAGAPDAIVEQRRGSCSLIFGQADVPADAMAEIRSARLPVGPESAMVGWRPVTQYLAGRPRPPKFYLQFGEPGGYGVCAEINSDLRRRDQSPASVVSLYSCRIGKDERLG
jgi:hypothetical protein